MGCFPPTAISGEGRCRKPRSEGKSLFRQGQWKPAGVCPSEATAERRGLGVVRRRGAPANAS